MDTKQPKRRCLWKVGLPVLLLLAAVLGAVLYVKRGIDRRLAAAIAAADRDDPYWRLDDLMAHREPVPQAENSAGMLFDALVLIPVNWADGPGPQPGAPNPSPSKAPKAYELLETTAVNIRLDDAAVDALRGALKTTGDAVKIARTVADYRRGRHELIIGPTVIDTRLGPTQEARSVARLMAVDAAVRVHEGDPDGALDSCRAILGVGRSIGDEPFLVSQLVRFAIGSLAMKSTRRVLGQGEPSDAALARLQALILDELDQPLLLHGVKGERAALTELLRRLRDGEVSMSALRQSGVGIGPAASISAATPWATLWFDQQRAVALEWMNDAVAIARRPATERLALLNARETKIARAREGGAGTSSATLAVLLAPALSSANAAFSRYQCELSATAILLAAERHRRKTGQWPPSVEAIDRKILPRAPADPFSGQAFRMEHRDGQLFIYSIGPNRQDEHGVYDPKKWTTGGPDDVGAIGWDVPLRRRVTPPEDKASHPSKPSP